MLSFYFENSITFLSYSLGEQNSWDCPDCGRTGNTGNYCGGCGHPAPWTLSNDITINETPAPTATPIPTPKPTPILTPKPTATPIPLLGNPVASIETSEDMVKIHVVWEGGKRPYRVYLYPYNNANHNIGEEVDYVDLQVVKNMTVNGKLPDTEVFFDDYLTPGQTYWIKIEDGSKQELWYKYTFPRISFDGFKVKIDYVFFEDRIYGDNGYKGSLIGKNKISKNNLMKIHTLKNGYEEAYAHSLIRLIGKHSDLFQEYQKQKLWGFTLEQPNGKILVGLLSNSRYPNDSQEFRELDMVIQGAGYVTPMIMQLSKDYQGWENIPVGTYTVIVSYGNYYVGSQEITITN